MKKIINGVEFEMTAEEVAEHTQTQENIKANEVTAENAKEAQANLKASAKAKLVAGEALTQEEADTIVL